MTKLEKLINELCPDGVEYVQIKEITKYEQPTKYIVKSTNYRDDFNTPVLTAGQTFILGYTNETDGIYPASKDCPVIIFDDFTGAFKWVDFPFKVKSSAMKIITADEDVTTLRYIYHVMGYLNFTSSEHKRLWIGIYSAFRVPLPPLSVQSEIVHILDSFTLLTAELTAELTARQKQYEYYRDTLLSFDDKACSHIVKVERERELTRSKAIKWLELQNVLKIKNGKDYKSFNIGNYPVYGSGGIMAYVDTFAYDRPSVLIPRKGSIDKLYYVDVPFWNVDTIFYTDVNNEIVLTKYVYYWLQKEHLEKLNTAGGVPSLTQAVLNKVKIAVPPLEEQERIVSILDRFDKLCNDISEGLPAEIEARQKQYEYYRDKLLTFKMRN